MEGTGSSTSAAILTVDINTAPAEEKLRTLSDNLGKVGTQAGQTQEPQQIQLLKTRIGELEDQIKKTSVAASNFSKVTIVRPGDNAEIERYTRTLKTYADVLDSSGRRLVSFSQYSATAADGVRRLSREFEVSKKVIDETTRNYMSHFEMVSRQARATASNVKSYVEALTTTRPGDRGESIQTMNAEYRRMESAINAVNAANANWAATSAQRVQASIAGLTAENTEVAKLGKHYREVSLAESRAISQRFVEERRVVEKESEDRRRMAFKQIEYRKQAEAAYTSWWVSELKKREQAEAAAAIRSAQQRSRLMGFRPEKLESIYAPSPGMSETAQAYLASGAIMGGGTARIKAESDAIRDLRIRYSEATVAAMAMEGIREKTNQGLARTTQELTRVGHQSWKATEATQAFHSALRGIGGALGALWLTYGRYVSVMIAAGAATKTVKDSFSAGLELNFLSQFVATVDTQGNAALQKLRELRGNIAAEVIKVSEDSVFTTQENVQALQKLSLAGIEASRGINLLGTATNAAVFGQTNLSEATGMVLDTLYNFNMASNDSILMADSFERVGNVMAYTAVTVNTTFTDLARAFQNITGVAGTFNIEIEEASALLQSLAEAGIRGQKAGTYVRNFLDDVLGAPISDRAQAAFNRLGVERFNPENYGQFGVSQYIDELVAKIKQLDFVEQQNVIRSITNQRSRRVLRQEIIKSYDEESKLINRVKQLAEEATGSLNRMSEGLKDTGRYALLMAQSAYNASITSAFQNADGDQVFQDIGRRLQSTFKSDEFKEIVTTFVNGVASMIQITVKFFSVLVEYKDVIAAVFTGALGGIALTTLSKLASNISLVTIALEKMKFAVLFLVNAFKVALASATAFALANPITAAIIAITATVGIGIQQWQRYKNEKDKALRASGETTYAEREARSRVESLERQLESARRQQETDTSGFFDTQVSRLEGNLARARENLKEVVSRERNEVVRSFAADFNAYAKEVGDKIKNARSALVSEGFSGQDLLNEEFKRLTEYLGGLNSQLDEARSRVNRVRQDMKAGLITVAQGRSEIGAIAKEMAEAEEIVDEGLNRLRRNVESELFSNVPETIRKRWAEGNEELTKKIEEAAEKLEKLRFSDSQNQFIDLFASEKAAELARSQANALQNMLAMAEAAGTATDRLREQALQAQETSQNADIFARTLRDIKDAQDVLANRKVMSAEALIGMSETELVGITNELKNQADQAGMTTDKLIELAQANGAAAMATLELAKANSIASGSSLDRIAEIQTQIDLIRQYTAQYVKTQQVLASTSSRGGGGRSRAVTEVTDVRKVAEAEYKAAMVSVNHSKRILELRRRNAEIGEYQYQQSLDALANQSISLAIERERRVQDAVQAQLAKTKDAGARQRLESMREQSVAKQSELVQEAELEVDFKRVREELELSKAVRDHAENREKLVFGHQKQREELAQLMALERQYNPIKRAGDEAVLAITRQYREELEKVDQQIRDSADNPSMLALLVEARKALIKQMEEQKVLTRELAEYRETDIRSFAHGWEQAFKDFYDNSLNYAARAREAFETFSKGTADAFEKFFMNPTKEGFRGLIQSFGQMLQQMVAKAAAARLTEMMFGSPDKPTGLASLLGGAAKMLFSAKGNAFTPSGPVQAFAKGGMFTPRESIQAFAKGGAFGDNVIPFARGSAFDQRGEILTNPTFFKFASGGQFRNGVAGEAGDEAVMPLKRMSDGRLGVHIEGGSGDHVVNINVNVAPGTPNDVKRAAGAGAREAIGLLNRSQRYG